MTQRRRRRASPSTGLAGAALVLVIIAGILGVLSSPLAWLVLVLLAAGGFWLRHEVTGRRRTAAVERRRQWLYDQSCLPLADAMSGTQFEHYVAGLLRMDGHHDVQLVGGPGDGGADILSAEPSGRRVAVQCKRQMAPIPVGIIRQLNGTLAHEHAGRHGVLVTTTTLTRPAAELAAQAGITVVDRDGLARWMSQARRLIGQQTIMASTVPAPVSPAPPPAWPQPSVQPRSLTPGPSKAPEIPGE